MDDKTIIDCPPYNSCRLAKEKEGPCSRECGMIKLRKKAAWRFGGEIESNGYNSGSGMLDGIGTDVAD